MKGPLNVNREPLIVGTKARALQHRLPHLHRAGAPVAAHSHGLGAGTDGERTVGAPDVFGDIFRQLLADDAPDVVFAE